MKFTIYQVRESGLRDYGFRSLEAIRKSFPDQPGLPREAWEPVYVYRTEKEPSLDWLYGVFNRDVSIFDEETPEDFTGHSMSVSDIVETPDGKLWFCDSFGWSEVQWNGEAG